MARPKPFDFKTIRAASSALGEKDRTSEARRDADRGERVLVPLSTVTLREVNTRGLNDAHVRRLGESIRVLGLLEPLVVDRKVRLLAGGHRLAAIAVVATEDTEAFARWFGNGVPVRMLDFNAEEDPDQALAVEIAENEHRRDYTREEAIQIAERLRAAGYRDTVGRPKKGERALGPALAVILGKNLRTIERLFAGSSTEPPPRSPALIAMESTLRALRKNQKELPTHLQQAVNDLIEGLGAEIGRSTDG